MSFIANSRATLRPLRLWVWLGFLLLSLVTTQWLGLQHSVDHPASGHAVQLKAENTHDRCNDESHSFFALLGHDESSIDCQLFDALTLAGIITGGLVAYSVPNLFHQSLFSVSPAPIQSVSYRPYQSRAPPLLIL